MSNNDNTMMYERYSNTTNKYRPGESSNSNYHQFSGLNGAGNMNPAGVASSIDLSAQPSDEEDQMIEVKGYGAMRLSQLTGLIKKLSEEIASLTNRGIYNVGDKADLLKLFADTYHKYQQ